MAVKKGDLIDEHKRYPDSCGLIIKVLGGGAGFEKVICCGHELTEEDIVPEVGSSMGRKKGYLPVSVILDEKKLYPDSCGLRVMIIDGGAGFTEIRCCGHSLTLTSMRELPFGQVRGPGTEGSNRAGSPLGTA
jgi:hypothetical protein